MFQSDNGGSVFSNVVCGPAQISGYLLDGHAVPGDKNARTGLTGVIPRCAVGVDGQFHLISFLLKRNELGCKHARNSQIKFLPTWHEAFTAKTFGARSKSRAYVLKALTLRDRSLSPT
jgi:hypothetical protein